MNSNKLEIILYNAWVILFGILTFLWVVYRGVHLSVTYDEVYTYELSLQSVQEIFSAKHNFQSANNHILNTVLIKPCVQIFGHQVWVLRLPNMLSFWLFYWGMVLLVKELSKKKWVQITGLFILVLNPFVLDFFSLSRGYGLAMAFQSIATALALQFLSRGRVGRLNLAALMFMLAILSNFTWINFCIPLLLSIQIIYFFNNRISLTNIWRINKGPLLIGLITIFLSYIPIRYLFQQDEFRWGSDTIKGAFQMLVRDYNYSNHEIWQVVTQYGLLAIAIWAIILMTLFIKKRKITHQGVMLFGLSIFFIVVISTMQRHFLQSKYMDGRKAIMMFLLINGLVVALIASLDIVNGKLKNFLGILISLIVLYHFGSTMELGSTKEWWIDKFTNQVVREVAASSPDKRIRCAMNWEFVSAFQYYNKYQYDNRFDLIKLEEWKPNDEVDFVYLYNQPSEEIKNKLIVHKVYQDNFIVYRYIKSE